MKKILLIPLLMFICLGAYCQDREFKEPDYDSIKKEIQDKTSAFYYPKLMSRLKAFDTTLSMEDYRHLYYGYIFQDEYQPYWRSADEEKLMKLYDSGRAEESDYNEIIQLATKSIGEFPFDLRALNILGYVHSLKDNDAMAEKVSYVFMGIIDAIVSTGNGKSCETSYHVISINHEYMILSLFQLQHKMQALRGDCDYFALEKNDMDMEGIFFNVKRMRQRNLEILEAK